MDHMNLTMDHRKSIPHAYPESGVMSLCSTDSRRNPPEFSGEESKHYPEFRAMSMHSNNSRENQIGFTEDQSSWCSNNASGGVVCSICPMMALKSCVTCEAAYCETHVRQHYKAPDLQRHSLVDVMECRMIDHSNLPIPKPIQIKSVTTQSVHLAWGAPEGLTETPTYKLTRRSEVDNCSFIVSSEEMDVEDLTPGMKYTFTVTIIDGNESQGPCVSKTVLTEIPPPVDVMVNVGPIVSVSWNKPAGVDEVSYLLTLSSAGKCLRTLNTKSLHCSFSELALETEFSISVSSILQKNGAQSKPVTKTIRTERGLLTHNCDKSIFQMEKYPIEKLKAECKLIKQGSPDCYLLPTQKNNIDKSGAVRRWTFGQRDMKKSVKNILVVGETGAGKTTLINLMVNYMLGVKPEDSVWFQITDDNEETQTKSEEGDITVYEVFAETSPLFLRVIDTPGYRSTDKNQSDCQNTENLCTLFSSVTGIHEISAVCLVVKSNGNSLTEDQEYIFDTILSIFGKDVEKNIVVMITHSDGVSVDDVFSALNKTGVLCAKDSSGEPIHFMFNNIQANTYKKGKQYEYRKVWYMAHRNMGKFFSFLQSIETKDLRMTEGVLRKRKQLEACVSNLKDAITMEEWRQKTLQQTQTALEEHKNKFEVDEPYKTLVPIQSPWWHLTKEATCCTICEDNCHYPGCWWMTNLSMCSVMKDGHCTVCKNRCPVSAHVKQKKRYEPKTLKDSKTIRNVKQQYEMQVDFKEALEKEEEESKLKTDKLLKEGLQCIEVLEDIALNKNSRSTRRHLGFLMKQKKKVEDEEKAQKLDKMNVGFQASKTAQRRNPAQSGEQYVDKTLI